MLTEREMHGIRELLNLVDDQVLNRLKGRFASTSRQEIIDRIIQETPNPSHLLRRKALLKVWIKRYILYKNIFIQSSATKGNCINACLMLWGSQIPSSNPGINSSINTISLSGVRESLNFSFTPSPGTLGIGGTSGTESNSSSATATLSSSHSGSVATSSIAASPNVPSNHFSASSTTPTESTAVSALPSEDGTNVSLNTEDTAKDKKDYLCKMCWDRGLEVVFLPCRHVASCIQCARRVSVCALCRTTITQKMRIYI